MLNQRLRSLFHTLFKKNQQIILDYPVDPAPLYSSDRPYSLLLPHIEAAINHSFQVISSSTDFLDFFNTVRNDADETDARMPGWHSGYLPAFDMIMLYTMISRFQPKVYLEVGCGTSTKVAWQCRNQLGMNFKITAIDPQPRKAVTDLADEFYNCHVQKAPLSLFTDLKENDILFFDGTHGLFPNSDVTWIFLEVLPRLASGVVVQFHDIYLPFDYPDFMLERYYNEQYLLASLLVANPSRYQIFFPGYFMSIQEKTELILSKYWTVPFLKNTEKHGGSFYIRIGD